MHAFAVPPCYDSLYLVPDSRGGLPGNRSSYGFAVSVVVLPAVVGSSELEEKQF